MLLSPVEENRNAKTPITSHRMILPEDDQNNDYSRKQDDGSIYRMLIIVIEVGIGGYF